jgi:hypothetical protein
MTVRAEGGESQDPMGIDIPSREDPWTIWFWRVVQIVGLLVFLEQVVVGGGARPDRPWILLIACAMMLGGFGMVTLIRAVTRIGGRT